MSYNLEDIELMITDMPRNGKISSIYASFEPQRKHRATTKTHIPYLTIPHNIISSLIEYFQDNPNYIENESWVNSEIPYFLWDVKQQHATDNNVQRLFDIPNVESLRLGQMD
jgi:hypothetical protein